MNGSVVVVDDDHDSLAALGRKLSDIGFRRIRLEESAASLAGQMEAGLSFDLALIDVGMPEMVGVTLLDSIKANAPSTACIMVTAVNDVRIAVECLNKGAYDYLVKPVATEELSLVLKRTLEHKRLQDLLELEKRDELPALENEAPFRSIITGSKKVMRVLKEAELHASSAVPVLITGESGTGKTLLARAIHAASPRASYPFTLIDANAPERLLLDAACLAGPPNDRPDPERAAYLEYTSRGTFFLEDVADLPLPVQGALLQMLPAGSGPPPGTRPTPPVDVRLIAATRLNLEQLIAQKRFRKDLFYRLRGAWLHLPPLRERGEDIRLLASLFLEADGAGERTGFIETDAMERLMRHPFPGNIRELKAVIQSAANQAQGAPIRAAHLPATVGRSPGDRLDGGVMAGEGSIRPLLEVEKEHILRVYAQVGANKSEAARRLGIGLNTLRRKLARYGRS